MDEDLDITHIYNELEINTNKTAKNSTNDIKNDLENINHI